MTADTVGGVWTYTVDLCKAFEHYGTEVHLMTMGALLSNDQQMQVAQLKNVTLYESNYKLEWMQNPWQDIGLASQWVASVYKKVKPDVIHFNNYGQVNAYLWDCPVVTVFHSCVQTWWQAVKGEEAPAEWEEYKQVVENALAASDIVVAPTEAILQEAGKIYGNLPETEIIYNGRDISVNHLQQKEPYVLSAGRVWDEAKNICLLSGVANNLDWPVYIAGGNTCPDTGVVYDNDNVHFLGFLKEADMQEQMAKAAVFCMPAKYEPFGLAVLEAALQGCALALGDIPTLRELWGDTAVFFNPFDEDESIAAIQSLIHDEKLRKTLAAKASMRAKDFTAQAMAGQYMQLYSKLCGNKQITKPESK
ncbi:glycosyltransferase family 4 protein [Flavobacterium sp. D11R37]|uniref:glycosyltransferase family 4 protein n=1 Tax=Flavobacterium coralii TaxID=2838017 RepID=UPI001CA76A3A|nr:glycosyltransferase family 4 protein [Flavobacterium coralii]MBY8962711.1 glycosyltransferase family 4 protein [Flavobacterium coralii]